MRRACFHHKDGSQPSALSESRYSLFALRFSLEDESISLVILSVIWACGAPIEMKIDHGGTEITEKTLKKLKLRALRVSVVNDFRRCGAQRPQRISDPLLFGVPNERRLCDRWGDCAGRAGAQ